MGVILWRILKLAVLINPIVVRVPPTGDRWRPTALILTLVVQVADRFLITDRRCKALVFVVLVPIKDSDGAIATRGII
jgi:hypothetical protein